MSHTYQQYESYLQNIADVKYASAVLQWDQETYLPPQGQQARGRQITTLGDIAHQQGTSPTLGLLLQSLALQPGLTVQQAANVLHSTYDYNRNIKLPLPFVSTLSKAINTSYHAWVQAKQQHNFALFEQPLQAIIELKRQEADYLGYTHHPYDALLNDYDKGLTTLTVDKLFAHLTAELTPLLQKIMAKPPVNDNFLKQHFDKDAQWQLGLAVLKQMNFNFNAGRQDVSEHPFTTSFGSTDVRLTTRVDANDLCNMLWSCIHEGGHGLYEQGLPASQYGLPLGEYCSLSIHESQSRLWENNVGRSLSFWQHNFQLLQQYFPTQCEQFDLQQFYKAINKVTPSLIRTEADEITYHFHVIIRYQIEKLILEGTIQAKDIPAYWNELYKKHLGVVPQHDAEGCLQDVHWSHGSFGYFATYSIGSLYAAQFYQAILLAHPTVPAELEQGNTSTIWHWLQQNIYQYGRQYSSADLCKLATGQVLSIQPFVQYAQAKWV